MIIFFFFFFFFGGGHKTVGTNQMGGRQNVKTFAPDDKVCKVCLQEKLSILRSATFFNKKKNK